jgi:zinc transporter ZupT
MAALSVAVVLVAQRVWAYALSFAAGAVTCMVIERLIPESHRSQKSRPGYAGRTARIRGDGVGRAVALETAFVSHE